MTRRGAVAWSLLTFLFGVGAQAGPPAGEEDIPPRTGLATRMTTQALWARLLEQRSPGEAIVGLKRPGARRGTWRGQMLVTPRELEDAGETLRRTSGVEVLRADGRGWAVVRLATEHALAAVRVLPVFDYIHPRFYKLQLNSPSGCDPTTYEQSSYPGPPKEKFLVNTVTGNNPIFSAYLDYVPWSFTDLVAMRSRLGFTPFSSTFRGHRIPAAWRRTTTASMGGAGVRLGVVDTGIYHTQLEIVPPGESGSTFATGMGSGRSMMWTYVTTEDGDTCGHGTRSATMAVSGINDANVPVSLAGAAFRADLASAQVGADVVMSGPGDYDMTTEGIRYVVCGNINSSCALQPSDTKHRIVSMAFGDVEPWGDTNVGTEIEHWYAHEVLFLGASGTDFCNGWAWEPDYTVYPADMPEVLPVTCLDPTTGARTKRDDGAKACMSSSRGVAGVWGPDIPTGGKNREDIWAFGGSSSCVATVSGIAALVWASHPNWSRNNVWARLQQSGHLASNPNDDLGFGVVDALQAVGGLGKVQTSGDATTVLGNNFHVRQTHSVVDGTLRYEWTDATCNGECRWNGTVCTGACPLVGTCPAGQAHPYCTEITRTASGTIGGKTYTKLTLMDESSQDQSDDVARLTSPTFSNCAKRSCVGRCGVIADGCGTNVDCGPCSGWYGLDVSFDAGAGSTLDLPAAPRQMTSFALTGGLSRVYSLTTSRHVRELAWNGTAWKTLDISSVTGAPDAAGGSLAGFASGGDSPRVYYVTSSGHVQALAWNGSWSTTDLTSLTGAPSATLGALEAFAVGGTLPRIYYFGAANGHLYELSWTGASWGYSDLTAATGAPAAVAGGALAGYAENGNNPRLFYVAAATNHVIQVGWNNGWSAMDISMSVAAAPSTTLNAYAIYGTLTRLHFLDGAGHVRELSWTGTAWQQVDVTAATGSPVAVTGSALAGFAYNGTDVRIYYQSVNDNHVRELSWANGWHAGDITQLTGTPAPKTSSPLTGFAMDETSPHLYSLAYNTTLNLVVRELAWY